MKLKCLLGHRKRVMPWLFQRDGTRGPAQACTDCGKLWYDYNYTVVPIEGTWFRRPMYEGQRPPHGHESWKAYHAALWRGVEEIRKRHLV